MVKLGAAWPSRSVTTLTGTPAAMSSVPWVWRRSCSRMMGTQVRRSMRSNAWEMACGWMGSPWPELGDLLDEDERALAVFACEVSTVGRFDLGGEPVEVGGGRWVG